MGIFDVVKGFADKVIDTATEAVGLPPVAGDLLKMAVDYNTGNFLKLPQDFIEFTGHAKSFLEEAQGPKNKSPKGHLGEAEPTPPPSRAESVSTVVREQTSEAGKSTKAGTEKAESKTKAAGSGGADDKSQQAIDTAANFIADHQDPDSFLDAIKSGKLPPEIANSSAAMMMIQSKMQDISRMNELMTNMMKAMHDLEMAIVRNIRA